MSADLDASMNALIVHLIEEGTKANGPASVPALPSHGSQHPTKDIEMNEATNSTAPAKAPDPLLAAIRSYKRGLAEFNFRTFDTEDANWNDLAEETYVPHLDALTEWEAPATSAEAAKQALRLCLMDDGGIMGNEGAVSAMIKAAYGYLKELAA
ncbi:hypothetical protein [uncultured Agrobacterium sp.]|uniref:hypothetical protein n=1 Tax=uncultured Agrobacterium sp. TaxID=157277 RepID=UPI00258DCD4B|nr:hypothetical protein [uncultured Agrobacterium sp.]